MALLWNDLLRFRFRLWKSFPEALFPRQWRVLTILTFVLHFMLDPVLNPEPGPLPPVSAEASVAVHAVPVPQHWKMETLCPQVLAGKPGTLGTWSIEKQVPAHRQTHGHRKETRRNRRRMRRETEILYSRRVKRPVSEKLLGMVCLHQWPTCTRSLYVCTVPFFQLQYVTVPSLSNLLQDYLY